VCCACGDRSAAPHVGKNGLDRGLAYIGRGKWICVGCVKTAVGEFALQWRGLSQEGAPPVAHDEPPPGFA
jgi:hypothetical protein